MRIKNWVNKFRIIVDKHGINIALKILLLRIPIINSLFKKYNIDIYHPIDLNGDKFFVDLSDPGISTQLILRGEREVEHVKDIETNVSEGMIGIDIGANIGFFAVSEAKKVGPGGKIYCIEPSSVNCKLLKKNIKELNYSNWVDIDQYIISGSSSGFGELILSKNFNSNHVAGPEEKVKNCKKEIVEQLTLDDFIEIKGIDPATIDFIRCDIEGFEYLLFQGMEKLFNKSQNLQIFIELHPDSYPVKFNKTYADIVGKLYEKGFKISRIIKELSTKSREMTPDTDILLSPSFNEYLSWQHKWPNGGAQAHFVREKNLIPNHDASSNVVEEIV